MRPYHFKEEKRGREDRAFLSDFGQKKTFNQNLFKRPRETWDFGEGKRETKRKRRPDTILF